MHRLVACRSRRSVSSAGASNARIFIVLAVACVATALGAPVQALGATTFQFAAKADYSTATKPVSVATGDLNGDGKRDLVVANEESNSVSVLLGNGDGTLKPKVDYAAGTAPASVALADVNGDKKPDLVVANRGAGTVSVLLGKGDGTFESGVEYATGAKPVSVATGDLNGDGKQDVVAANEESNSVSVLLGNGDGTFASKHDFATGTAPRAVALGDLNADGKQDIAVANLGSNSASILLGKGDGSFTSKQDFPTGTAPQASVLGDLNGDGKPDIATANATASTVSVLLNSSVPALEASPSLLSFPSQLFATKSAPQKVTVTNTGSAPLSISSVIVTGNFAASGCSGASLSPGASCSISVTFSPKGYGALKGEAAIATNAGSKAIKLTGTGLPPVPLVATGAVGEIAGTYATLTGTVVSQGPGSFYFEYGATKSYGSVTPTLPLSSSANAQQLAATLSLPPGASYHYRMVASNLAATINGTDQVFTIAPESPLLKLLKHGRLSSVLRHGLRLRVSGTSPGVITVKLRVDAQTARAAHLIPARSKRKTKVTVGSIRVTVAANRWKTVTVKFGKGAKHNLAALGRVKLTIVGTPLTFTGSAGSPTSIAASIRR
jgi:hypothetical protein